MTKISASIVADSICNGHQITTMLVTFPRMILAEFNTHRMFSRNSASSRAIPFEKMLESVRADPFIPIAWQADHKGMQGSQYIIDPGAIEVRRAQWLEAMDRCCSSAWALHNSYSVVGIQEDIPGVTKQICNRLLEPFMWHTVLVTATEWENFYHLRCPQYTFTNSSGFEELRRSRKEVIKWCMHVDRWNRDAIETLEQQTDLDWLNTNKGQAEIHMMALAEAMWDQMKESEPQELLPGQWHIPFGPTYTELKEADLIDVPIIEQTSLKIATARAAQTSYTVVGEDDKKLNYERLIALHDRLLASGHMSPFEHCAQAMTLEEEHSFIKGYLDVLNPEATYTADAYGWCHNLRGWKSYRSMIPNESRR